jgi:hypothetical protein
MRVKRRVSVSDEVANHLPIQQATPRMEHDNFKGFKNHVFHDSKVAGRRVVKAIKAGKVKEVGPTANL